MIDFDFEYYRPANIREAVEVFQELEAQGKRPHYYGGGTETICLARIGAYRPGSVIDLKGIPECSKLGFEDGRLVIGSSCTLSQITESGLFPLLGETVGRIADHTIQVKITLGGNLGSRIRYRVSVLPLLLADSLALVTGPAGDRRVAIAEVFAQSLRLGPGEFVVWVETPRGFLSLPHVHHKWTRLEKIGYPLVTICAVRDGRVRLALSGVCDYPFRSAEMEAAVNDRRGSVAVRAAEAARRLPAAPLDDSQGSAGFRRYALETALADTLRVLESRE